MWGDDLQHQLKIPVHLGIMLGCIMAQTTNVKECTISTFKNWKSFQNNYLNFQYIKCGLAKP